MAPLTLSVVFIVVLGLTGINALHSGGNGGGKCKTVESRLDSIESAIVHMEDLLQSQMERIQRLETPAAYSGCQDALRRGKTTSGVYTIAPDQDNSFDVYCEQQLDGGGWTVFQARHNGSVDFYKDWNTYKTGFGSLTGEFWLGNENLHQLTKHHDMQLKVILTNYEGDVAVADYSSFSISNEALKYKLSVTGYSGAMPPGDSMSPNNGRPFSTYDQDNDLVSSGSCAKTRHGAWWYRDCTYSNLNGRYGLPGNKGVFWYNWTNSYKALKATRMMMRTRR